MRILVIGGTQFVGRHLVEVALARGHELTLFHRGQSGASLFPGVERIRGDRETNLDRLAGRRWDAVVDCCGYRPHQLAASTSALKEAVGAYLFISTISVYRDFRQPGITEAYPAGTALPGLSEGEEPRPDLPIDGATYGPLKARAEQVVREAMPDRHLIVRPGIIIGPQDKYTRFNYWIARARAGGRMAVPGRPDEQVQFIDARDLGAFMVRLLEAGTIGTVQATGPASRLTHADMIEAVRHGLPEAAEPVWIAAEAAVSAGVELPVPMRSWVSLDDDFAHIQKMDIAKALSLGLTTRPLEETVRDIRGWLDARGGDEDIAALAPVERRLLELADGG
ncbi:NAD-dependent epimerase/dehydratase family protein [Indioceanicola profundi]|uniref:NAD-dependent epimerase/dehydratase family protein n=1 Tax=Indioceanicola profundi TaxID=2220096 RepID=UPI000E6AB395|nr:NAD-dependent epimerase/dehydratase family protein [Indioceanicola profundi]